jgi:hypothetical protein
MHFSHRGIARQNRIDRGWNFAPFEEAARRTESLENLGAGRRVEQSVTVVGRQGPTCPIGIGVRVVGVACRTTDEESEQNGDLLHGTMYPE